MEPSSIEPRQLPASRILGAVDVERRMLLACIDVAAGYVCARHRSQLLGWHVEAALVEARSSFRGGETVALRARPSGCRGTADLPPFPSGVLHEIGSRITASLPGIATVVPDIASIAPDVAGRERPNEEWPWLDEASIA